jgi:putative sterol carrier protein
MADATKRFFERLGRGEPDAVLGNTTGSLRLDLESDGKTEHWRVALRGGAVTVSHAAGPADCVIRTEAALFEDLASGRANVMAATLRGQILLEGDPGLMVRFQRLFPAPTGRKITSSARTIGKRRG